MDWTERISSALHATYGEYGSGMANRAPDAVAEYVHWVPARDHIVFATRGAHRHRFPHEFVMRVAFPDPPRDSRLWEVGPMWPTLVLAKLADVEHRSPRPFAPGNHITNVPIEGGAPFRHFSFLRDPVLSPLTSEHAPDEVMVFVAVIPLTDAQRAAIDAIPHGATNTVLRDWAARDPLFLVPPA